MYRVNIQLGVIRELLFEIGEEEGRETRDEISQRWFARSHQTLLPRLHIYGRAQIDIIASTCAIANAIVIVNCSGME